MFYRIDHMLYHKTRLHKFKRIKIISSIFSDHKSMLNTLKGSYTMINWDLSQDAKMVQYRQINQCDTSH